MTDIVSNDSALRERVSENAYQSPFSARSRSQSSAKTAASFARSNFVQAVTELVPISMATDMSTRASHAQLHASLRDLGPEYGGGHFRDVSSQQQAQQHHRWRRQQPPPPIATSTAQQSSSPVSEGLSPQTPEVLSPSPGNNVPSLSPSDAKRSPISVHGNTEISTPKESHLASPRTPVLVQSPESPESPGSRAMLARNLDVWPHAGNTPRIVASRFQAYPSPREEGDYGGDCDNDEDDDQGNDIAQEAEETEDAFSERHVYVSPAHTTTTMASSIDDAGHASPLTPPLSSDVKESNNVKAAGATVVGDEAMMAPHGVKSTVAKLFRWQSHRQAARDTQSAVRQQTLVKSSSSRSISEHDVSTFNSDHDMQALLSSIMKERADLNVKHDEQLARERRQRQIAEERLTKVEEIISQYCRRPLPTDSGLVGEEFYAHVVDAASIAVEDFREQLSSLKSQVQAADTNEKYERQQQEQEHVEAQRNALREALVHMRIRADKDSRRYNEEVERLRVQLAEMQTWRDATLSFVQRHASVPIPSRFSTTSPEYLRSRANTSSSYLSLRSRTPSADATMANVTPSLSRSSTSSSTYTQALTYFPPRPDTAAAVTRSRPPTVTRSTVAEPLRHNLEDMAESVQ